MYIILSLLRCLGIKQKDKATFLFDAFVADTIFVLKQELSVNWILHCINSRQHRAICNVMNEEYRIQSYRGELPRLITWVRPGFKPETS
jgi:hypothetical protein